MNKRAYQQAIFAGGCFWCVEHDFRKMPDLINIESGYTGGEEENPSYEEVANHKTGHREAVRVTFDPVKTSYRELVEYFFTKHDPTDAGGSFHDRGYSYSPAIYCLDNEQCQVAEAVKGEVAASGRFAGPIVTEILSAGPFYVAEDYHQNYATKEPVRYGLYRAGSGRDTFLEAHQGRNNGLNSTSPL